MSWLKSRKKFLYYSGGISLLLVYLLLIAPRINVPRTQQHTYLIYAGKVSRAMVQHSHSHAQTGKLSFPRLPQHLEFTSSNGPVDIYVLNFSNLDPQTQVTEMMDQTDELQAGHPPEKYVAKGEGEAGRIALHSWPYGTAKYIVLIRAIQASEVVLKVHFGP